MSWSRRLLIGGVTASLVGTIALVRGFSAAADVAATDAPRFTVDPLWPKPLPDHWLLGSATGIAIDRHDHVFVLNLPNSFNARTEIGASTNPPTGNCCLPAPPVLVFDAAGNLIGHWGGPGDGYHWPAFPAGITVDGDGNVWIGGGGTSDAVVLEFTNEGKFVREFGKPAAPAAAPAPGRGRGGYGGGGVQGPIAQPPGTSSDMASFGAPAGVAVDSRAGVAFVADGYRNRRIAVINLSTGAIERIWGGYGKAPSDAELGEYDPAAPPAQQFRSPVCAHLANDGTLYVCDRGNDRIQLFRGDGTFLREQTIAPATRGEGSVWDIAFSPDAAQRFLYVADGMNDRVTVLDRRTLTPLTSFGDGGRYPGEFTALHSVATDSHGNLYTAETYEGKRVQKFVFNGIGPVTAANQGVVWPH